MSRCGWSKSNESWPARSAVSSWHRPGAVRSRQAPQDLIERTRTRIHERITQTEPQRVSIARREVRARRPNEDRTPVEITSKRGDAVLIGIDDYRALEETAYLLRSPANVRRLLKSLEQARAGKVEQRELDG